MIVYLDASALVKIYILEDGSRGVENLLTMADLLGTAILSRAEVSAAICKAVRTRAIQAKQASEAVKQFRTHWLSLFRLGIDGMVVEKADRLAWDHQLRGYDAIHLACALLWQESLAEIVTMATFDKELWIAAKSEGMAVYPAMGHR
jgi:uncharacterized protein